MSTPADVAHSNASQVHDGTDRPFIPAEAGGGRVDSETGRLREVIVHRPGVEVERLTPINAPSLLFDDALDMDRAQAEHDQFTQLLRDHGVIVHDYRELLAETLVNPEARAMVLEHTVGPDAVGVSTSEVLSEYLSSLPATELANVLLAGITCAELRDRLNPHAARTLFDTTFLSTLDSPFVITPLPNHLFSRDASSWLYGVVTVHSMALAPRQREAIGYEAIYRYHPAFRDRVQVWTHNGRRGATTEGGDVQVMGHRTLAIGLTHRSNAAGVEQLATRLFDSGAADRVVGIHMPDRAFYTELDAVMHLDTLMTMVSPDTYLRFDGFKDVTTVEIEPGTHGHTLNVTVHDGDQMDQVLARAAGVDALQFISPDMADEAQALRELARDSCNVVALEPGTVIGYAHNRRANDALRDAGIEVLETPGVELVRGRGGAHCMTCPVTRDAV